MLVDKEEKKMDNFEIYIQNLTTEEAIRCVPEDHEVLTSADFTYYAASVEPYQPLSTNGQREDTTRPLHLASHEVRTLCSARRLAWAITIHKSQGMTLQRAIVRFEGAHTDGRPWRTEELKAAYRVTSEPLHWHDAPSAHDQIAPRCASPVLQAAI